MSIFGSRGARLRVGSVFLIAVAMACGSQDDKKQSRPSYPGDGEGGEGATQENSSGRGGHAGDAAEQAGEGSILGGAGGATAGKGSESGGEPDESSAGATGLGGAGSGQAGETSAGGVPATSFTDSGRAISGPLVFEISPTQTPAIVGQQQSYVITVGNTSDLAVEGVNLLMRLPVGMSLAYAADALPDVNSYCGNYVCDPNEEAPWNIGTIEAHTTRTVLVRGTVLNTVGNGDSLAPLFRLSAKDVDVVNVQDLQVPVQAASVAELTLTADADPAVPGQLVELSLDVGQTGQDALAGGKLQLQLPGGLSLVSASDDGKLADDTVSWDLGAISVGASFHRSVMVKVHPSMVPGDILNPRASLSFSGGLDVDNTAALPISVVSKPEPLSLTVSALNSPGIPNGTVGYQLTVANTALRSIDNIQLLLPVPPEISFAYAQDSQPDVSTYCGNYVCGALEEAFWNLGTLEAGTSQTVTVIATIDAKVAGSGTLITAPFALRAPGVNPVNVLKTVPVYAKPSAQLVLGTEVAPVAPDQTFSYQLDVGQIGAKALANSTLTVYLPPSVSITAASDQGKSEGNVVSWNLGTVGVAASAHRSVDVKVPSDALAGSTLFARARLSYDGGTELDAQSELPVSVVAEALPLSVTVAATPAAGVPSKQVLYTTTIKNNAARAIDAVSLMLRTTPEFSFGYAADADPDVSSYCGNYVCGFGEEAPWSLGTLNPGKSSIVTANVTVAPSLTAGSLITARQILTATDLGGTIFVQKTIPTQSQ
ncbi:MAG TPA: hypothetical protein VHB79_16875 [Polyangiaceae bacterium]|nr:hypothetical protein [Polyangiaceae bacterium]